MEVHSRLNYQCADRCVNSFCKSHRPAPALGTHRSSAARIFPNDGYLPSPISVQYSIEMTILSSTSEDAFLSPQMTVLLHCPKFRLLTPYLLRSGHLAFASPFPVTILPTRRHSHRPLGLSSVYLRATSLFIAHCVGRVGTQDEKGYTIPSPALKFADQYGPCIQNVAPVSTRASRM